MARDPFQSEEAVEFTEDNIGDFLLNILTDGLYDRPDLIIREYIQNSHDAICDWTNAPDQHQGRVDIKVEWPNIHIFDNGPGMDRDELLKAMSNLGKSFKNITASSGFMGIGKLAGLAMAARVEIHSTKYGSPERNWVVFNSDEMLTGIMERRLKGEHHSIIETLNQHTRRNNRPIEEDPETHYTVVHLLDIHEDDKEKIENIEDFIRSIGLLAPVAQNPNFEHAEKIENLLKLMIPDQYRPIDIFVNETQVYRPYYPGLEEPKTIEVLDDNGDLLGYGWACLNISSEPRKRQIADKSLQSIALMRRGIAVGDRDLAENMGIYSSLSHQFRWYSGELYIVDPRIILSADRTRVRQSQHTIAFIENASKEFKKLEKYAENFSARDNAEVALENTVKTVTQIEEQINSSGVTSDRLPKTISDLTKAQSEIEKRRKHIDDPKIKEEIEETERKVKQVMSRIVEAQRNTHHPDDETTPISEDIAAKNLESQDVENLNGEEEKDGIIIDIPEKLDFSPRETLIYRTVMQAISDIVGGRKSEKFIKIAQAIETALTESFGSKG